MKTKLSLFSLCLVIGISLLSCSKGEKSVPIKLLLTDNPAAYDSVNIHIQGIKVKMNTEEDSWTSVQAKDTTVNLLDLQNGITTIIAQDNVPAGVLKEVRFILGSDNYVVVDGIRHDLSTPSAEDSGLKIKIDKELGESLNTFVLDFDADLSVKEQNGAYKLMPVIKLK
ncbi:MAG TPA: DUF4382 domain-containing protein [Flavisolibacter sp.]|nr:DUF4382 domain-containing protein [Flavisolibacter sp.]